MRMLLHLLISTLALSAMMTAWYGLQRLVQRDRSASGVDFLRGRWGCASCSDDGACDVKKASPRNGRST